MQMAMGFEGKSDIGIFDINFDTGERAWSHELRELFGIPRSAPPDFQLILQRVHPEDRRAFNAIAMEPFRPDCPARKTSQFRIVWDDGSVHWMHLVRMTIFREEGAHDPVRVLGFVVEISGPTGNQRPWRYADIAA
jgi:PAS domain-containing protein